MAVDESAGSFIMIRRWTQGPDEEVEETPRGFDAYELRLGDIMRGERATMGKSLLDVQRELKIKAGYIAAIENSDPSAFDTPGFIAGFVRSYARYLGLDPDWAFQRFSEESGFETAHGMSAEALPARKSREDRLAGKPPADALLDPTVPFRPMQESMFAGLELRAMGSLAVLLALVAGLGYGGWALLKEVQRVELAPVDQAPSVGADVATFSAPGAIAPGVSSAAEIVTRAVPPSTDALERLYRPAARDVPVLVPRDAPIASLDPGQQGVFAAAPRGELPSIGDVLVTDGEAPEVTLIAVLPTWVRIQTPGRSVVFEKVLEPGEEYAIPVTEETPVLRAGNAGSLYFRVNGTLVGPAGQGTTPVADVQLASTDLSAAFPPVNPLEDRALFELLDELGSPDVLPRRASLEVVEEADFSALPVALVAVEDSWVRVRDASGDVRFEGIVAGGASADLPEGMEAPTIRAGNAGALYFQVGESQFFGPAGEPGGIARKVALTPDAIREAFPAVTAEDLGR